MKKYILLLFAATIVAGASAQTNYYNGQIIYIDPNFTFKCTNDGTTVLLQNMNDPVITEEELYPANMNLKEYEFLARQNRRHLSNRHCPKECVNGNAGL